VKKIGAVIGVRATLLDRRAYAKRSETKIAAVVIPILAFSCVTRARPVLPSIHPNPHNGRPKVNLEPSSSTVCDCSQPKLGIA
jgi:hypothetical protein